VKPFLKLTRAMPLDPSKPMATRTLINAGEGGRAAGDLPRGRITVTGSLMKVYDGVGLIADKSGAMVVPVRIEGLEATPFSRLSRSQVHRRWFPKVTVTVLEPVKLAVADELKGPLAPPGRGRGAVRDHVRPRVPHHLDRPHRCSRRWSRRPGSMAGSGSPWRIRSPARSPTSGLLLGAAVLGRKLMPLAREGKALGVMLPNANGAVVTILGVMSADGFPR
jgi:acyl-[acyl-carrier-protein]-phospholipid O-acyltransferase/long-chain-fatty-acid--[acyl-carrier-protein] ligase